MLVKESYLLAGDNSGAKDCKIIFVYNNKIGTLSSKVLLTVRTRVRHLKKRIVKGFVCKGIIVQMKRFTLRKMGINSRFKKNRVILIKRNTEVLLGSRVRVPVSFELKRKGFKKIITLSFKMV